MKKTIRKVSFISLCLVFSPVQALDFVQALEKAETSDPDILAAEFNYQAELESRPQSLSALLPNINLLVHTTTNSQETSNSGSLSFPDGSTEYDSDGYTLSLTQSLYNHSNYLTLAQADLNIAKGTAEVNSARQALILRVADAYYNILAAVDNLIFARSEKKAIGQQLEQTKKRFDVGLIAITDVKESQAQYDISVAQEISAENELAINRETLRSLIGEAPEKITPLAKTIPLVTPDPADINQWVDIAHKNNLSLKSAQYALDIARKQVSINRSGHYPTLDLSLQHGDTSLSGDTVRDTTDTSISIQLNVPIYSGGYTNANVRQATALKEQARALRDKAQRTATQTSRASYLGVTTSIAQVTAYKQALASTQTAYEATQAGFEVGTRTAVDVLIALREQYRAERDYSKARYTYILSLLRLKQAAGILSKDDAIKVNQWLKN